MVVPLATTQLNYVDCSTCASRPYTFVVMALFIAILGGTAIVTMPVDIFPYIDIPVMSAWSGSTPAFRPRRWKSASSTISSVAHHDRQRHRAHRVAVLQRHRSHAHLFPAERQDRYGGGAGDRDLRRRWCAYMPPGIVPPSHPEVRRLQRADPSARPGRRRAQRSSKSTTWATTSSAPSSPSCRASSVLIPCRRQAAPGDGGSESAMSCRPSSLSPTTFRTR